MCAVEARGILSSNIAELFSNIKHGFHYMPPGRWTALLCMEDTCVA